MVSLVLVADICLLGYGSSYLPKEQVRHADVIELNHVWRGMDDWNNDLGWFDQWVVWKWYPEASDYHVMGWCPESSATIRKYKGYVELRRREGRGRVIIIRAYQFRETRTAKDVEVEDRKSWPIKFRPRIWEPPKVIELEPNRR